MHAITILGLSHMKAGMGAKPASSPTWDKSQTLYVGPVSLAQLCFLQADNICKAILGSTSDCLLLGSCNPGRLTYSCTRQEKREHQVLKPDCSKSHLFELKRLEEQ